MSRFSLRRVLQYALVMVVAVTINFMLPRIMPGNPLALIAGVDVGLLSPEQRTEIISEYGLDLPLWQQYLQYWGNILTGDFGFSYRSGRPISEMIAERLPWTLLLTVAALALSAIIGIVSGAIIPPTVDAERMLMRFSGKLSQEEDEILNRATQTIVSQVENLKTLVNAFSDYAKPPELKKELGGLNDLIMEITDLYAISHPGIVFDVDLLNPEPNLLLDKGRMTQLLTNLIKNAQESVDEGEAKIHILTRQTDNHLQLSIKDNGHGFKQENLAQVFEPYESTKTRGSGLGLAIVKKIVEEHGGEIKVANHDDGALITIQLPVA